MESLKRLTQKKIEKEKENYDQTNRKQVVGGVRETLGFVFFMLHLWHPASKGTAAPKTPPPLWGLLHAVLCSHASNALARWALWATLSICPPRRGAPLSRVGLGWCYLAPPNCPAFCSGAAWLNTAVSSGARPADLAYPFLHVHGNWTLHLLFLYYVVGVGQEWVYLLSLLISLVISRMCVEGPPLSAGIHLSFSSRPTHSSVTRMVTPSALLLPRAAVPWARTLMGKPQPHLTSCLHTPLLAAPRFQKHILSLVLWCDAFLVSLPSSCLSLLSRTLLLLFASFDSRFFPKS